MEFFNGETKLGEDLSSPYSFTWNNVATGTYVISAVATDNQGTTASDDIEIFVNAKMTAPIANAGEDITVQLPVDDLIVQGSGTDSDGVITPMFGNRFPVLMMPNSPKIHLVNSSLEH